ncbi:ABC transporter [Fictibacillus macauensis ZFHKF-1]|uniref:ABC transporter n=1 Tax=Fictibacillus macauensis ZFHKF-1 TaxID=1196324 RepID=I8J317_9BACL|nr:ATP-binding cassette domain-containing protein [Fictibacillus macauensis]EIT86146.1 ABC transporter [Fictibacillus macauensis ZFHKF-1]
MKFIEARTITKRFRKNTVLQHISLSLEKGKIYGFQGINGSGKTMLFRALLGLIQVNEGAIYIKGERLQRSKPFPVRAGVLLENPGFIKEFTGRKNLQLLASLQKDTSNADITSLLQEVGLQPDDPRKVKKYSLGMKQKLGIAQALLGSPEFIVLDEPTNALDENSLTALENLLHAYKRAGATLCIASHDKAFLQRMSDQIFTIHEGTLTS